MTHPLRHRLARWALMGALIIELAVLARIVFTPSAAMPSSVVWRVSDVMTAVGVPADLADPSLVEFVLNIAMFVPIGATLALLVPRVPWWIWTLIGLAASSFIEAVQLFFLDARSATLRDIWANTLGLAVGALIAVALIRVLEARRRQPALPKPSSRSPR